MDVVLYLIPASLLVGIIAVGCIIWFARTGQFDDLDGQAHRILMEDDHLTNNNKT